MVRDVSTQTKLMAELLPLNNSVCVMLAEAYFEGYTDIEILGSPMIARDEYLRQRAALAMCIGYIRGMTQENVYIKWPDEPEKVDYFKAYQ